MNSVIALVGSEPAKAERALIDLSEMLRYALASHADASQDEVSFREELQFTEGYLALESLRLGKRLQVECTISPETLGLEIPALTLQPLVENSVKHGIATRATGGTISISAHAVNFQDRSSGLGSATLGANGNASISVNTLGVGSHEITAVFTPTNSFLYIQVHSQRPRP